MNLALAVTFYDEIEALMFTLERVGQQFACLRIVQSGDLPFGELERFVQVHPNAQYERLPNLDRRTTAEKQAGSERFEVINQAICRNHSQTFRRIGEAIQAGTPIDYVVAIHGDTGILHIHGIRAIIQAMIKAGATVGVSRAMGQSMHRADLTREQMADPNHPKGGRLQDESNRDFMPQFFITHASLVERMSHIEVTNPWCGEQCYGDATGDAPMYVFSRTAYGFHDGIIYHLPSPENWKHAGITGLIGRKGGAIFNKERGAEIYDSVSG